MDFRDGLSADLPSPRDDEPASLRDDIVDELADHLACMYRRELLRGADASLARARVMERFGDPAAVARRLWFEAMKGTIMAQRILVSCCVLLTLISLALAGVLWMQAIDSRRLAAVMTARAEFQLHEAQKAQEQMLKQLAALSKAAESPKARDWNPVTFKLTELRPDGPPAVGFLVELTPAGTPGATAMWRASDSSGTVEFGSVEPGDYQFLIRTDSVQGNHRTAGMLNLAPGRQVVKQVVCPRNPPERVPIRVQCELPADLANQGLLVNAFFISQGQTVEGGWQWDFYSQRSILCGWGPEPGVTEISHNRAAEIGSGEPGSPLYLELSTADLKRMGNQGDSIEWDAGNYRLMKLGVLRRSPPPPAGTDKTRFDILAQVRPASQPGLATPTVLTPETFWQSKSASFMALRGEHNEWTIPLPQELVKAVREKLKVETEARTK
jgi:hypothetical protein